METLAGFHIAAVSQLDLLAPLVVTQGDKAAKPNDQHARDPITLFHAPESVSVAESGSDVNLSMAWEHKFLVFSFLGAGLTQEFALMMVDGTPFHKLPEWEELKEELKAGKKGATLTDVLNKFGEQGWHVASQSIAPDNNLQHVNRDAFLHFMTLKREV